MTVKVKFPEPVIESLTPFSFFCDPCSLLVFGQRYHGHVYWVSILLALCFTIGAIRWIHQRYKKHILSTL